MDTSIYIYMLIGIIKGIVVILIIAHISNLIRMLYVVKIKLYIQNETDYKELYKLSKYEAVDHVRAWAHSINFVILYRVYNLPILY